MLSIITLRQMNIAGCDRKAAERGTREAAVAVRAAGYIQPKLVARCKVPRDSRLVVPRIVALDAVYPLLHKSAQLSLEHRPVKRAERDAGCAGTAIRLRGGLPCMFFGRSEIPPCRIRRRT